MRIGITAYGLPPLENVALAQAAEEVGFSSYWLGEHLLNPVAYRSVHPERSAMDEPPRDRPIVDADTILSDPFSVLSAVAAATTTMELGTAIYLLVLRHPLITARAAWTLQQLAEGRFLLGLGTGWLKEEFAAVGVSFDERIQRFDEAIDVLRAAWRGGPFTFSGRWTTTGLVQLVPEQVTVPIVYGGNSDWALRRAARHADGWFASGTPSLEAFLRMRDKLEAYRTALGRQGPFRYFVRAHQPDPDLLEAHRVEGVDEVLVWARSPYSIGVHGSVWPTGELEEQRCRLGQVARDLGLSAA